MLGNYTHQPVLMPELIAGLAIKASGIYVDLTFGRGGHTKAILDRLDKIGKLFAIDKDPEAIAFANKHFANDPRFKIKQGSFSQLASYALTENISEKIDGIILDLGVSSPQLDNPERGFSFMRSGPLDMRMDPSRGRSVAVWLETVDEKILAEIIKDYGEERYAKRIAKAIVTARTEAPILTTQQLAEIVSKAHPAWEHDKHPATRTFQALRIFINQELDDLKITLPQCLEVLKIGGRLAVISFHSLEDRLVKNFIQEQTRGTTVLRQLPIKDKALPIRIHSIGKAIKPSAEEIQANPRSRSATLRIMEKLK